MQTRNVAPSPGAVSTSAVSAVGLGDRGDDREAEAGAAAGSVCATGRRARTVRRRAPRLVVAHARAFVAHLDDRVGVRLGRPAPRTGVPRWSVACARSASRLASTWRRRASSPGTTIGAVRRRTSIGRSGDAARSVVDRVGGESRQVDRLVVRGAGPDRAARAAADRRRARPCGRRVFLDPAHRLREVLGAVGRRRAGTARRSPRIDVSGVRSSCEASATNRRRRASDAVRSANASSICASIAFSARPRRPTSVCSSAGSTRRERSPAAIAPAVSPISLQRPQPELHDPPREQRRARAARRAATSTSMSSRRCSVSSTSRDRNRDDERAL